MRTRSTIQVMWQLMKLVKPLFLVMMMAVLMGCLGYFCASFITVLGGYAIVDVIQNNSEYFTTFILIMACIALLRGVLHYIEQYCNHYIAFTLLAFIRDRVFLALRKLAPAKLEGKDKGNLVSIITSDIELLEVFYAHTLSPICIALFTSSAIILFVAQFSVYLAFIVLLAHVCVGILIPIVISKKSKPCGEQQRSYTGHLNASYLDGLRGIKEVLQFDYVNKQKQKVDRLSKQMEQANKQLKKYSGLTHAMTSLAILGFGIVMLGVSSYLYSEQMISLQGAIVSPLMLLSSFGAVSAMANLGAGLAQTIASGNRVLDLLEEEPMVHEVSDGCDINFENAQLNNISFAYGEEEILKDYSLMIKKNEIIGIHGKSGCGKSTTLKLLMRFWDVQRGEVLISNQNIKSMNTKNIRNIQSYVTQETHIFHDTIAENIRVAKLDATLEEIQRAAKQASIHEFIMSLPQGYNTMIGELGDTISGGEKQRIGIARAFLHDAELILLDEPTSNLDSLNEAVILKALQNSKNKTMVLVSHRTSTMRIVDTLIEMKTSRES